MFVYIRWETKLSGNTISNNHHAITRIGITRKKSKYFKVQDSINWKEWWQTFEFFSF